jgi:hypothetical protein
MQVWFTAIINATEYKIKCFEYADEVSLPVTSLQRPPMSFYTPEQVQLGLTCQCKYALDQTYYRYDCKVTAITPNGCVVLHGLWQQRGGAFRIFETPDLRGQAHHARREGSGGKRYRYQRGTDSHPRFPANSPHRHREGTSLRIVYPWRTHHQLHLYWIRSAIHATQLHAACFSL